MNGSKVIVIAGASSGIGEACAREFSDKNNKIILLSRNEKKLINLKQDLKCEYKIVDLTESEFVEKCFLDIEKEEGKIDLLINCVGEGLIKELHETKISEWEHMINTNATSAFLIMKNVLPIMYKKNDGYIINISSEAGMQGYASYSAYCAAKFALVGLCESAFQEARLKGVRISLVSPGDVDTPFMDKCPIDMGLMDKYGIKVCDKDKMLKPQTIAEVIKNLTLLPKNSIIFNIKITPEDYQ